MKLSFFQLVYNPVIFYIAGISNGNRLYKIMHCKYYRFKT